MIGKHNRNLLHAQLEPSHWGFHLIYFSFIRYYKHECLACLSITALSKCSILETRRGCWIPWNWRCELPCGYCKVSQIAMTPEQKICLLCLHPWVSYSPDWVLCSVWVVGRQGPDLPNLEELLFVSLQFSSRGVDRAYWKNKLIRGIFLLSYWQT